MKALDSIWEISAELIEDVYLGTQYVDGIVFEPTAEKVAA